MIFKRISWQQGIEGNLTCLLKGIFLSDGRLNFFSPKFGNKVMTSPETGSQAKYLVSTLTTSIQHCSRCPPQRNKAS